MADASNLERKRGKKCNIHVQLHVLFMVSHLKQVVAVILCFFAFAKPDMEAVLSLLEDLSFQMQTREVALINSVERLNWAHAVS